MPEDTARPATKATLSVGGHKVPMNQFVESALVGVVNGFLSALRDVGPGEVTIVIPAARRPQSKE